MPGYAPPPPRARSGGRSCLLGIVLLLTLVCVSSLAGAFVFRDQLRGIPGLGNLPIIGGGITPTIARPPVQTGSATVGSGQAAAIAMPNGGPLIEVPHGAVPANPDGTPGTLTFSVAPAPQQSVSLPPDMALSGPLYQFEPEGVTFAVPVRITLPIPAGTDPARVMGLITRDPQSGAWVPVTGIVDAAARTVSAEVTHFSPYGIYSYTGSDLDSWYRANGGWFVIENQSLRSDLPYPGCRNLPRALYVKVCIQQANPSDPGLSYLLPADNLLALGPRNDFGTPYRPLKTWLPAGTYRVVHYVFMSEINTDPMYVPCFGWWVKPPQVINLQAGQTVTFEPFSEHDGTYMTSFNLNTCTGTPAVGGPAVGQPTQPPMQPPSQPVETHGACLAKMNGEWDATLTLRETNDPDSQDEIGDTETTIFFFQINGANAQIQIVAPDGERSDFASGTCTEQDGRYIIETPESPASVGLVFKLRFNGNDRMTGDVTASEGEMYLVADVDMTRRTGSGQPSSNEQPSDFTPGCAAMTGVWNTTMTLRSSTNPNVPTGGTRRGVLTMRVEGDSAEVQWTEGGRSNQAASGTCTAQGDRYQITLSQQVEALLPPGAPLPPPNAQVPLEEVLFPVTFDLQFEGGDRLTGAVTSLANNYEYKSDVVMSRQ